MSLTRFQNRWDELNELYHQAQALPAQDVDAFCKDACGDDSDLYQFLRELVDSAQAGDSAVREAVSQIAQSVSDDVLLISERVGAYQLDSLLGRGGMGEVYLASRADGQFEKQVAIKVVRQRVNQDEMIDRFQVERQVLANLEHPGIPALLDAGLLDDGRPYFVCRFVHGVPIDEYCEREQVSTRARLELLQKVGEALRYAHDNLILHLDVKPDNILVDDTGTPFLLDFGIAQLVGDPDSSEMLAFSPRYASPEQVRGERPTAAADVFGLGVVFYELLTGDTPFSTPRYATRETVMAERHRIETEDAGALNYDGLPVDLAAILQKMMAPDLDVRYRSIESCLRDLYYYQSQRPVSARAPTFSYRLRKYLRRNSLPLTLTVSVISMLVAFGFREAGLRREAAQEAATATQVSAFLSGVFENADPRRNHGNSMTARELLDKGVAQIDDDLADQPLVAARLKATMGDAYISIGLYSESLALFEQALAVREPLLPEGKNETGRLVVKIGRLQRRLGRMEESEATLRRAIDLIESGEPDSDLLVYALGGLASTLARQRRFDEALQVNQRRAAVAKRDLGAQSTAYADALWALGQNYSSSAEVDTAERHYLESIEIHERVVGSDSPSLPTVYQNLANLYGTTGRYEEAEAMLDRSMTLAEKIFGGDHPFVGTTLMSLGKVQYLLKRYDEAEQSLTRSVDFLSKHYGPEDFRTGLAYSLIGHVYFRQGRIDLAREEAVTAIATLEKHGPRASRHVSVASKLLALIYHNEGDVDQAESFYVLALEELGKLPRYDPDRVEAVEEFAALLRETGREVQAESLEAELE